MLQPQTTEAVGPTGHDRRDIPLVDEDPQPVESDAGGLLVRPFVQPIDKEDQPSVFQRPLHEGPEAPFVPADEPLPQHLSERDGGVRLGDQPCPQGK
jgi:hypothetical protein